MWEGVRVFWQRTLLWTRQILGRKQSNVRMDKQGWFGGGGGAWIFAMRETVPFVLAIYGLVAQPI